MLKVYIKTYGCQMNTRDSGAVAGLLKQVGYDLTDNPKTADVILVNTCAVRLHAEERALSLLGAFKKFKIKRDGSKITGANRKIVGVIGCMAKNRGKEILEKMPYIDLICSPSSLDKIPEYIEQILKKHIRVFDSGDRAREEVFYQHDTCASVVISTGCSNHCTYCVVPDVRGEIRLRRPEDIIAEVKRNVCAGITKITLLGQNVNDYKYMPQAAGCRMQDKNNKAETGKTINFVDLLKMAADVEGVEQIDFLTSHPKNTSTKLFELIGEHPKIKKQLHLPIQSGSDKILRDMNRGYTRDKYLSLIESYKKITGGAIGTDIIVGFPGETGEDFLQTKALLEQARFDYAYIFVYSPRPGTPAAKLNNDVPLAEKKRRHAELLALQKEISNVQK